jgi:hypothetical protein
LGHLLREVDLIIWDEVPMQHCFAFCDLRENDDNLSGGVTVLLRGDFPAEVEPGPPPLACADHSSSASSDGAAG